MWMTAVLAAVVSQAIYFGLSPRTLALLHGSLKQIRHWGLGVAVSVHPPLLRCLSANVFHVSDEHWALNPALRRSSISPLNEAATYPASGRAAPMAKSSRTARPAAFFSDQQSEEMIIASAGAKKSVLTSTSASRRTSVIVTPPSRIGIASTGTNASKP